MTEEENEPTAAAREDDEANGAGAGPTQGERAPHSARMTRREKAFAAIAACAAAVAIVCAALYAGAYVPADAAAKVGGGFMPEARVAAWIEQYRAANSLADDRDFASHLLSQNKNVATFRQEAVNQLALGDLVVARARELGAEPSEEEARAQLEELKRSLAFGDDETWADTIASYGLTEEGLVEQYKANLARAAVLEADVPRREASDAELLSYARRTLAGTTQKHACRILFRGEGAYERALECHARLSELARQGELTLDAFMEEARAASDEEGAGASGGDYAWSGAAMDATTKDLVAGLGVGEMSEPESLDGDGGVEIVFCDEEYAFPPSAEFASLPGDVPEGLMEEVRQAASDAIWSDDCDSYLASLLAGARITYYPVPEGAAYDVPL